MYGTGTLGICYFPTLQKNVDADRESRTFNDNTEWALNDNVFDHILHFMASHLLICLHLESIKRYHVMCHGSQIPKLNLLTHILTPGIKGRDHDCSTLAEPIMVFKVAAPIGGHSPIATSDRGYSLPSKQASSPTSYGEKVETDCMQVIREHITKQ